MTEPNPIRLTDDVRKRMADKTACGPGCWEWKGTIEPGGHGRMRIGNKMLVHRIAWAMAYGPIPDGALVCHKCGNPACVNPEHLYLGDKSTNAIDLWHITQEQQFALQSGQKIPEPDRWQAREEDPMQSLMSHPSVIAARDAALRRIVTDALRTHGSVPAAAESLGCARETLQRLTSRLRIDVWAETGRRPPITKNVTSGDKNCHR